MFQKLLIISFIVFVIQGCTTDEMRIFNRAMHDSEVQQQRDMARDRCLQEYYDGRRRVNDCNSRYPYAY